MTAGCGVFRGMSTDPSLSQRAAAVLELHPRPMEAEDILRALRVRPVGYGHNSDTQTTLSELRRVMGRRSSVFEEKEDGSWRLRP
jgi:hypothetical protein